MRLVIQLLLAVLLVEGGLAGTGRPARPDFPKGRPSGPVNIPPGKIPIPGKQRPEQFSKKPKFPTGPSGRPNAGPPAPTALHLNVMVIERGIKREANYAILDDAVQKGWDEKSQNEEPLRELGPETNVIVFSLESTGDVLKAQTPSVFVEGEGVTAVVKTWNGWEKILTPIPKKGEVGDNGIPHMLNFAIKMECNNPEASNVVMVKVRAFGMDEDSPRLRPKVYSFGFVKKCGAVDSSEVLDDSPSVFDLNAGTNKGLTDIIKSGNTQASYKIKGADTKTLGVDKNSFHAEITTGTTIKLMSEVVAKDPTIVEPKGYMVPMRGGGYSLGVRLNCRAQGTTAVHVTLVEQKASAEKSKVVGGEQARSVKGDVLASFWFKKECPEKRSVDTHKRPTSDVSGVLVKGFSVFVSDDGTEVVADGRVSTKYEPARRRADDNSVDRPLISADQSEMEFTVILPEKLGLKLRRPWVSSTPFTGQHPMLRPKLAMDKQNWSDLTEKGTTTFKVVFGCFDEGISNVVVSLALVDQGILEFVLRKKCDYDVDAQSLPPVQRIEGLYIGTTAHGTDVAENGLVSRQFEWGSRSSAMEDLYVVPADQPFVTFTLRHDTEIDVMPFGFEEPTLIATDELAETDFSGPGAYGDCLDGVLKTSSSVSVTFHCVEEGRSLYTLILPLSECNALDSAGDFYYDYDYDEDDGRRRLLQDNDEGRKKGEVAVVEDKAIKISFIKVCSHMTTSVPSKSGLGGIETPGFRICTTKTCDEGTVVVNHGFPTAKYFGQRTKPESERTWDIVQKSVSRLYFLFESDSERHATLEVGTPEVTSDSPVCEPELGGRASKGIKLPSGKSADLQVNYHCRYEGQTAVTVVVPIGAGSITFTLAKKCNGKESAPGEQEIPGLMIGTSPGASDVVKDGLAQDDFKRFMAVESTRAWTEYQEATVFYIRYEKRSNALTGLEPMIFSHRPWVNVDVEHALHVQEGDTQEAEADEIAIDGQERMLNVSYQCVFPGTTAISMSIPILPTGSVQFHWAKVCGADDEDDYYSGIDDTFLSSYDDYYYSYSYDDYDIYGYDFDSWEDYGGGDYGDNYEWDETRWNPDAFEREEIDGQTSLGWLNVGTYPDGKDDVASSGRAADRYALPTSGSPMQTTIGKDKAYSQFVLSVPKRFQSFGKPEVRVQLSKAGKEIANPVIVGPAAAGGRITSDDKDMHLTVKYNCEGTGVTPVLVVVPLLPANLGSVSFRVVKICGTFETKTDFAWTPNRIVFTALGAVALIMAACICYLYHFPNKDAKYSKVATGDKVNQVHGVQVELDAFDGDLSDDSM